MGFRWLMQVSDNAKVLADVLSDCLKNRVFLMIAEVVQVNIEELA